MERIKVSIWCFTYNHKDYIRDAIESFLKQVTDFQYEIIIHDDASTDGTSDIVKEYVQKYPDKIKAVIQEKNLFSQSMKIWHQGVATAMEQESKGKFVAWCEGDDFWLDIHKLQIQIDYMESHPACVMTAHNAIVLDCKTGEISKVMNPYDREKDLSAEELIMWYHGNLPSASTVFRKEVAIRKGFFVGTTMSGDWEQQLYCISKGDVHYFDRIMSCYRAGVDGSYTQSVWKDTEKRMRVRLSQIYFLFLYDEYTNHEYQKFINAKIYRILKMLLTGFKDMDVEQFEQFWDDVFDKSNIEYRELGCQIKDVFKQTKVKTYCTECLTQFVKSYEHIVIMGDGELGKETAERFNYNGLQFDGFVVSNGHKQCEKVCDKPVWDLDEVSLDKDTCGVVIAVRPGSYLEVIKNLHESGFYKTIYVFEIRKYLEQETDRIRSIIGENL